MTTQPKPLWLADQLELVYRGAWCNTVEMGAAAELRRLHAVNADLVAALKVAHESLLSAQELIEGEWGECRSNAQIEADGDTGQDIILVRAAIAKAEA